jgi:tRNA-2-methylthio-N6-dimethylallyladenosine synthase
MRDVKLAATQGAIEICFLGQNVNGYKYNLADLVKETAKIINIKRIRYTSSYPTEMTDELIALHGTEQKLLPFLNLPIQSGSVGILNAMNRPYTVEKYMEIISKLRAVRPDIQISSDFIVGFPGETDDDFKDTCNIAEKVGYINSYSFKYSKRPHTAAAIMQDQIPDSVKRDRLKMLEVILNENVRKFNKECIGKTFDCLLEDTDKTGKFIYRTPYMQQVITDSNGGNFCKIKITDGNKCSLRGEVAN